MKTKLLLLAIIVSIVTGCRDEVVLNTAGNAELTFLNQNVAVSGAEIRINTAYTSNFEFTQASIFQGNTNENGVVSVEGLTLGQYKFRLTTDLGYLFGVFIINSDETTTITYDLDDFSSSVTFAVDNAPATKTGTYYLFPNNFLGWTDFAAADIIANSVEGSLSNGVIMFGQVLPGDYTLLAAIGNTMEAIESTVRVSDEYPSARPTALGANVLLEGETWDVVETVNIQNNMVVDNVISTIGFSGNICTFTFLDGTVVEREFLSTTNFEGASISVFFQDRSDIHPPSITRFNGMSIATDDFSMDFRYTDATFFNYSATLSF